MKRDAAIEKKLIAEAKQLVAGYENYEQAHEAYGWAEITEKQLDMIRAIFDDNQVGQSQAALRRINQFIGSVEGEIVMFRNDSEYRKEIMQA